MENFLKEVFCEEPEEFNFNKYSDETIRKVFKLNEPRVVTGIKEFFKIIAAIIAVIVSVLLSWSFLTSEPETIVIHPAPVVQTVAAPVQKPQVPKPEPVPVTPKPTVVEDTTAPSTEEDTYDEEYISETPSSSSSYNFFEDLFNGVTGLLFEAIGNIDVSDLSQKIEDISTVIKDIDSDESKAIIDSYKADLIDRISDSELINDDTKRLLIDLVNNFTPDINSVKDFILNGREKIETAIETIGNSVKNGEPMSKEEIEELFKVIFEEK